MKLDDLYPEVTKWPLTLGPHKPIYISDNLIYSYSRHDCNVCNNNTSWRDLTGGTRVAVCSIECIAEINLNGFEARKKFIEEAGDIIEALDTYGY